MKLGIRGSWLSTFEDDEPAGFSTEADRIELEKRQGQVVSSPKAPVLRIEKTRNQVGTSPHNTEGTWG